MSDRRTARRAAGVLLSIVAATAGLWLLIGQLLAVVPVSWTEPLLRNTSAQTLILAIGGLRDGVGSWNLVIGVLAVLAAVLALRIAGRGRRVAGTVTALSALGLVLTVITAAGLAFAAHDATGRWILFAAPVPFRQAGAAPDRTITYATLDGQPLQADLYLPKHNSATAAPLVVSIHGGAFIQGSRGTNPYTTWLAEQGYAVLDVDYRLADDNNHRWDTEDADIGCAMVWAADHAAEYRWDTGRVATLGGSAGGNLAINVANKINAGTLRPSCGTPEQLPRVCAAIALYPAVDLAAAGTETALGVAAARQYVGGTPQQYPDRYTAIDSAPHVGKDSPPTLMIQGGGDHLVFAEHTAEYAEQLTAAGIRNRYVELPFLDHAFGGVALDTGAQVTRPLTLSWLREYVG